MYRGIEKAIQEHSGVELTEEIVEELEFWRVRLADPAKNGLAIKLRATDTTIHVDASEVAYGAAACGEVWSGELDVEVLGGSSTLRELRGLRLAVCRPEIEAAVSGKRLHIVMDSMPAVRNLENGGGKQAELTREVRDWCTWLERHNIECTYEHVLREYNTAATASKQLQQTEQITARTEARIRDWLRVSGEDETYGTRRTSARCEDVTVAMASCAGRISATSGDRT